MTGHYNFRTVFQGVLNCRQRTPNAGVIGDFAVFHGDVEIQAKENSFGVDVQLVDGSDSGQATTADLLEKARQEGHEFEILAKPVHPTDLLAKLRG